MTLTAEGRRQQEIDRLRAELAAALAAIQGLLSPSWGEEPDAEVRARAARLLETAGGAPAGAGGADETPGASPCPEPASS